MNNTFTGILSAIGLITFLLIGHKETPKPIVQSVHVTLPPTQEVTNIPTPIESPTPTIIPTAIPSPQESSSI